MSILRRVFMCIDRVPWPSLDRSESTAICRWRKSQVGLFACAGFPYRAQIPARVTRRFASKPSLGATPIPKAEGIGSAADGSNGFASSRGEDDPWLIGINEDGSAFPFAHHAQSDDEFAGATFRLTDEPRS